MTINQRAGNAINADLLAAPKPSKEHVASIITAFAPSDDIKACSRQDALDTIVALGTHCARLESLCVEYRIELERFRAAQRTLDSLPGGL